jgi:hypothetical protein
MNQNINKEAQRIFVNHPEATVLYGTEDGNIFYVENLARQHAKATGSEHFVIERSKVDEFKPISEKIPVASKTNKGAASVSEVTKKHNSKGRKPSEKLKKTK